MSSKGNRRAKGDKGPAKSSMSGDFMAAAVNMDLLNGITFDTVSSSSTTLSTSQCVTYFGNNDAYRTLLKLLSKKSTVTRTKVGVGCSDHV